MKTMDEQWSRVVRQEPAPALEKFRRPLLEYLASGLDHPDKQVRHLAAGMLGATGDARAIRHLVPLLVCEDHDLRAVALQSLSAIEDFKPSPDACDPAICDNCLIRGIAEEALGQLRNTSRCASFR